MQKIFSHWSSSPKATPLLNGNFMVERFMVDPSEAEILNRSFEENCPFPLSKVAPGQYTKLTYYGAAIQVDLVPMMEMVAGFVEAAHGDVLVTGLGLGLMGPMLVQNPNVKTITFMEYEPAITKLVEPRMQGDKPITVIFGDARQALQVPVFYDCVFHDLWQTFQTHAFKTLGPRLIKTWAPYVRDIHAIWGGELIGLPGGMRKEGAR